MGFTLQCMYTERIRGKYADFTSVGTVLGHTISDILSSNIVILAFNDWVPFLDLDQIHFGSNEIWKPDILLYNSAESGKVRQN